ncbi:procathepsin L-like [Mercenaria mercenaria]|uniref:procathepsin L-like n=1 Tax=Mercenaria mercenaria TaxID=6596 RepID=UPI00234F7666|nr:procathepsin L-like [Mercenaria mercenaria]
MEIFMKFLLLVVSATGVMSLTLHEIDKEWFTFKVKFNRTYDTRTEENYRYTVFTENLKSILVHNMEADKGRYTFWLGINQFSDLTSREFNKIYANLRVDANVQQKHTYAKNKIKHDNNNVSLPREIDWRHTNCVTHVKNQGSCGSCYAFAATGALEGQECLKNGELVSLSEQNIIDCTNNKDYKNHGCENGRIDSTYLYVLHNGIDSEKSYPYKGSIGTCDQQKGFKAVKEIFNYEELHYGDVAELQRAVAEIGPISVYLDIDTEREVNKFQHYKHGVFDNSECGNKPEDLNHAVLVVGYGETLKGQDYWLIKNSYGTAWGIEGYMKIVRNGRNTCGIATRASFPIVPNDNS